LAAKAAAKSGRFDAIVAIGCVIRGETAHFDYICQVASAGIAQVGLETGIPVTFGVLTTDNEEQARARSEPGVENKGYHAAQTALEMIRVLRELR
jgi:6,7-dimethyl-8-ribityllumazine synthase